MFKLLKSEIILSIFILVCAAALTSSNGTFTSPNFPRAYKTNSNCRWLITVDSDLVVDLSFNPIYLAYMDYIRIYDGALTSDRLILDSRTTQNTWPEIVSSTNEMLVVFTTMPWTYSYMGFNASYNVAYILL